MKDSLTDKTFKGMLWGFLSVFVQAISQVIILAFIARLLSPQEFGLVGAAMIVISFTSIFYELGVGPALVQRSKLENRHIRLGFTLSIFLSLVFAGFLLLLAETVSSFFRMPLLNKVLPILAILFPLNGFSVVATSLLHRNLKFKQLAIVDIISYAFGFGVTGILLAYLGFGIWSLVWAYIAQAAFRSAMLFFINRHEIGFLIDVRTFCELMSFGGGFTIARIANYLANQGDNIIAGKYLGAKELGIYGRAYQLMVMPATLFNTVIDKVLFSAMAKVQNNSGHLVKGYRYSVAAITILTLPLSVFCFIMAPQIVHVLLGTKWDEVIVPFQILSLGMTFRTSYKMSDSLSRATGAVYRRAWRQVIYAILVFLGSIVGAKWGVIGIAHGVVFAVTVNFILMVHLSLRLIPLTLKDFLKLHISPIRLSIIIFIGLQLLCYIQRLIHLSEPIFLTTAILVSCMLILYSCWKFPAFFLREEGLWILSYLKKSSQSIREYYKFDRSKFVSRPDGQ